MLHPMPCCQPEALCEHCYQRDLAVACRQARVLGSVWAERVARDPAHRGHASWPDDERALAIATRKVVSLSRDPRMREDLAWACAAGAVAWWGSRPARYRPWSLVTAPDEQERCMVVLGDERCQQRTAFRVVPVGAAWDEYAYVCADHVGLVAVQSDAALHCSHLTSPHTSPSLAGEK